MYMRDFHRSRAEAAVSLTRDDVDVLLLFPGADMGYLTGFFIGPSERLAAALIPVDGDPLLFVNEMEGGLRGQHPWIEDVGIWREHEDPVELLAETIRRQGSSLVKIGLADDAPWGWVNRLGQLLPGARFINISQQLSSLMMIKTPQEVEWMRRACAITDRALRAGFDQCENQMTERELAAAIVAEMNDQGGGETFCTTLFGERAALPHGTNTDRKLKPGEAVLVDAGTRVQGYWSDITRTVFYGEPTRRQRELYGLVQEANQAAFNAVKEGACCEDVDDAGRGIIVGAGLGEYFIHRLGHGVGLQVHEHPYIVRGNRLRLRPGMTFTIEPGVYIAGELGIRVEDTVVCVGDGCERLTMFDRSLTSIPLRG